MYTSIRSFAIVNFATAVSLATLAAPADAAGPCNAVLPVRARLVEQADQGVDALRRYIVVTQAIHQLNIHDVAARLDAWRADIRCAQQAAAEKATPTSVAGTAGD
jgi:hypothetical protein